MSTLPTACPSDGCGGQPNVEVATPTPVHCPASPCPEFAIGIDVDGNGTNDCGTGVPLAAGDGAPDAVPIDVTNTTCTAEADATLAVSVYLMDNAGIAYEAQASHVYYSGLASIGYGSARWLCATFEGSASETGYQNVGATIGPGSPCNVAQTNVGLMSKFSFTCTQGGSVALGHGQGETGLYAGPTEYREAGVDALSVICGSLPTATPYPTATPTPGGALNFAIGIDVDGDGDNDCGTGVPSAVGDGAPDAVPIDVTNTNCVAAADATLAVSVYLMDNDGISYKAAGSYVSFTGVTSNGHGSTHWTCHVFDGTANGPNFENAASIVGISPQCDMGQTNLGLMNRFSFACSAAGSISLENGLGETKLSYEGSERREADSDILTISCGDPPEHSGDANCSGTVNSIDAALILQNVAGLLANIPCATAADANGDGTVNSIDAALVLQVSAGLLDEL